jgi:putative membrane protein
MLAKPRSESKRLVQQPLTQPKTINPHMKNKTFILTMAVAAALCALGGGAFAKVKDAKADGMDASFIKKAANGGMTEVELGKIAAEKGGSQEVKDFGNQMVKDHSKAGDQLKEVASKMSVEVPSKVDATHQMVIDKMSTMSGAALDKAYVKEMIKAHEKDIAAFEKADKEVKNVDLKKFIEDTLPTMKGHLEMIKKFDQAKS